MQSEVPHPGHFSLTSRPFSPSLALPEESLYHLPFGTKDAYVEEIMTADLDKLASLIKICGFLMQTKVYLLWKNNENRA